MFAISKDRLIEHPNTYFAGVFSGNFGPESDGSYFIDRNPANFMRIMNFFRNGVFDYTGITESERSDLEADLDYYGVQPPQPPLVNFADDHLNILKWNPTNRSLNVQIIDNDTIATKVSGSGWDCAVAADRIADKFKVQIVSRGPNGYIMVGFVKEIQLNAANHLHRTSYMMYVHSGQWYNSGRTGAYTAPVDNGGVIEGVYDREKKEISFAVDGRNCGVAFKDVEGDLFPLVEFHEVWASVKLLG